MLTRDNYTKENIDRLRNLNGNDPSILERTVFAFGLLEAITKTGMPFIFKGGTCLMLLLEHPRRLSTDIDIIVEPDTDIDKYIEEAGKIFPFISQKEDVRKGHNNIVKRHYEFTFNSLVNNKPLSILLDVLFEENHYSKVVEKPIQNELLLTEGENLAVKLPGADCILGDKLTAFAPHTTGVPFGVGKELEVIKQLYDCYTLSEAEIDFDNLKDTYNKIVITELGYRGLDLSSKDVLADTIRSCICIITRGSHYKEDYENFVDGIRRIQGHIVGVKLNPETARGIAGRVLYLAACLYENTEYKKITDIESYLDEKVTLKGARGFRILREVDSESYAYIVAGLKILDNDLETILA